MAKRVSRPAALAKPDRARLGFGPVSVAEAYEAYLVPQLFEPWAADLVARAGLFPGAVVLDVATGTGVVARQAAAAVGPLGKVFACDLSAGMLAFAASKPSLPGSAPIEYLECSATALAASEASFDAVLCQQGLQFFSNREAALREMHRVARQGGRVIVSTWAAERPLGLFGPMVDAMVDSGMDEPFPRAFDSSSYGLGARRLEELFLKAGFAGVSVETAQMDALWETTEDAVETLNGTPFAPLVAALDEQWRQRLRTLYLERLAPSPAGTVTVATVINLARGIK